MKSKIKIKLKKKMKIKLRKTHRRPKLLLKRKGQTKIKT